MSFAVKGAEADDPSLMNLRFGREGWLYSWYKGLVAREAGTSTYHPAQLEAIMANLDRRAAAVRATGAQYLFFATPDKSTIYPEYLPSEVTFLSESHLLQQRPALAERDYAFDLVDPLLARKPHQTLYFKTDSHWNYEAGRIAADLLLAQLGQEPLTEAEVIRTEASQIMDLGRYLDPVAPERFIKYSEPAEKPYTHLFSNGKSTKMRVQVFEGLDASRPSCVFFRDSYSSFFVNYLLGRFSRIVLAATREYQADLVASERPDVVITQIAERYLNVVRKDELTPPCVETFGVDTEFLRAQTSRS